jgi:hypothetical protein
MTSRPAGNSVSASTPAHVCSTVVVVFDSGDEMVIRAMPARKKYVDLLP